MAMTRHARPLSSDSHACEQWLHEIESDREHHYAGREPLDCWNDAMADISSLIAAVRTLTTERDNAREASDGEVGPRSDSNGMTLRDYFASQALISIVRCDYTVGPDKQAKWAYDVADSMMAARDLAVTR